MEESKFDDISHQYIEGATSEKQTCSKHQIKFPRNFYTLLVVIQINVICGIIKAKNNTSYLVYAANRLIEIDILNST